MAIPLDGGGVEVAPGDPGQLLAAAGWHADLAAGLESHAGTIAGVSASLASTWDGEAAGAYQQLASDVANHFKLTALESRSAAAMLTRYAHELERCQREGAQALLQAEHWVGQVRLWSAKVSTDEIAVAMAGTALITAETEQAVVSAVPGSNGSALAAAVAQARRALTQAQEDLRNAQRALREAQHQLQHWQARGRQAWEEARNAAEHATGLDELNVTPPPLAGLLFTDPSIVDGSVPLTQPMTVSEPIRTSGGGFFDDALGALGSAASTLGGVAAGAFSHTLPGQALGLASALTGKTMGVCVGGSFSAGGSVSGTLCYDATPSGQSGLTLTAGGGVGGPLSLGGFAGATISDGRTLGDQGGPFSYVGGSAKIPSPGAHPFDVGGSYATGQNRNHKTIHTVTYGWSPSVGLGSPVTVSGGRSYTWTVPAAGP